MLPRFEHSLLIGSVLLASCQPRPPEPVPQPEPPTVERPETLDFQPVEWADMPGWTERDLAPALQALFLLLRPGGTLVLGLRDDNSMASLPVFRHGFSTYHGPELQQALEQAGFTDASLSTFAEDSVDVLGDTMHKQSLILTVRKPREATS